MNAKQAKSLRRQVYGDTSLRIPREYKTINRARLIRIGNCTFYRQGTQVNIPTSLRAQYQQLKRNTN